MESENLSVDEQVARTAAKYGDALEPTALALTLALYRVVARLDRAHSEELAPVELNVVQLNVLNVLHRAEDAMTMGELALAISVRPANLTGVVDSLVSRGFVERRLNPHDRRSFLVGVTEAGDDFLAGFLPGHWQFLDRLLRAATREEREALTAVLLRVEQDLGEQAERSRAGASTGSTA